MTRQRRPAVAMIGAGRLATALVPRLAAAGYVILAVASRTGRSARRLARSVGARSSLRAETAARGADVVLIAVPDREIAGVADRLAREIAGWDRRVVLHHAGALGLEPLLPLARAGAAVGLLHPLQVLGLPRIADRILPGSRARIEGEPRARRVARRIARDLGLLPLVLPRAHRPAARAAYHAAASLVANDLVALLAIGADLLRRAGLSEREALGALLPLAAGALSHVEAGGLRAALTGPVARGDARTLSAQLRSLSAASPEGAKAHRALSRRLLRLVRGAGLGDRHGRSEVGRVLGASAGPRAGTRGPRRRRGL